MDTELKSQEGQQQQGQQEKTFTQAELEKIIGERLHRERSKYETELKEYQETLNELEDFGYTGTVQEKREAIRAYKAEIAKAQELEQLKQEASTTGTSPELLAEIRELKKELSDIKAERQAKEAEIKQAQQQKEAWESQTKEFEKAYPDVDLEQLDKNSKFLKFIKGKTGTLKEMYEDFVELVGEAEASAIAKAMAKNERSTGSGKSSSADGGGYGLTDRQKMLAQKSGQTYKEYAEYLKQIT
jgi:chromosome segregation ATPase